MKLQVKTIVLVLLALGLGSFVYIHETRILPKREATKSQAKKIFNFTKDDVQAFSIQTQTETLKFERLTPKDDNQPSLLQWQMKSPKDVLANNSSISFLLSLLANGKQERSFLAPPDKLSEYGLDKPLATVEITLKDQQTHQLILGKPDLNRSFLYAQIDPSTLKLPQIEILLVPIDFEYGVKRSLTEWEADQDQETDKNKLNQSTKSSTTPSLRILENGKEWQR
jgi:hypothetical protein